MAGAGTGEGHTAAVSRAQGYAHSRGLCGDIGPFRHVCTRLAGHDGRHQGVRVDDTDERIYATWGD
jgi:hypothetical protein